LNTHALREGRQLIAQLLEEWPAPRCDATDGAHIYLRFSCRSCGTLMWPEDEYATAFPQQTECDSCRKPNVLTFPDGDLLLGILQEIVFAWPRGYPSAAVDAASRFLQRYAVERNAM
jgi:hypothetical protein